MRTLLVLAFAAALVVLRPRRPATPLEVPLVAKADYRGSALATPLIGAMGILLKESAHSPTTAMVRVHSALETAPITATELLRRPLATQPTSVTAGPVSGPEIRSIATKCQRDLRRPRCGLAGSFPLGPPTGLVARRAIRMPVQAVNEAGAGLNARIPYISLSRDCDRRRCNVHLFRTLRGVHLRS